MIDCFNEEEDTWLEKLIRNKTIDFNRQEL